MTYQYQILEGKVDAAIRDLTLNYPAELNTLNRKSLEQLRQYCNKRVIGEPVLGFSTSCKNCNYSLSEILNYIELVSKKESEILIVQSKFVSKPQPSESPRVMPRVKLHFSGNVMTVQNYRSLLSNQLTSLAPLKPEEEIELDIEMKKDI